MGALIQLGPLVILTVLAIALVDRNKIPQCITGESWLVLLLCLVGGIVFSRYFGHMEISDEGVSFGWKGWTIALVGAILIALLFCCQ